MNESNKDDYGVVYYFEKRKLHSPPGYEINANPKRIKLEEENISSNNVIFGSSSVGLKKGSLLNMCFQYISNNIAILDSLIGLPEMIGKELFIFMLQNNVFKLQHVPFQEEDEEISAKDRIRLRCLGVFSEAYETLVLNSLSFSYAPKPTPSMSLLLSSFEYLIELDLSGNYLNDGMLVLFSSMRRLKTLVLSDCQLLDATVQKLTLPYRMYPERCKEIQILDLSNNSLTLSCMKFLQKFTSLRCLNLSNTLIKIHHVNTFTKKNSWEINKSGCVNDLYKKVETEGWAKEIIEQISENALETTKSKKSLSFYPGKKEVTGKKVKNTLAKIHENSLILVRLCNIDEKQMSRCEKYRGFDNSHTCLPNEKKTIFSKQRIIGPKQVPPRLDFTNDDNEDDILLQYKKNEKSYGQLPSIQ